MFFYVQILKELTRMYNSSFCKYGLQGYKSYKVLRQKYVCLYDAKFKNTIESGLKMLSVY
jgi:hypothetical protein